MRGRNGEFLRDDKLLRKDLWARLTAPDADVNMVEASFHDSLLNTESTMMDTMHLGDLNSALLEDGDVIAAVKAMSEVQQADFIDYLSTQNSMLGESNPFISLAMGCGVNLQPLVST